MAPTATRSRTDTHHGARTHARTSIRTRLLLLVFAVWLPAAAGFGVLAWYLHQQETSAIRRHVEEFAAGINTDVEQELDKRAALARALAASKAARDADFARFHEEASTATRGSGDWALLTDTEWHLVNTLRPYPSERVARALKNATLTEREPNIVFVPVGPISGKPSIAIFAPIPDASPQRYNVGISFEPAVMQRIVKRLPEPFQGLVVILNNQQVIMARSRDPEKWFGESASPSFKSRVLSQGFGFRESTTLDGVPSLTYLTPPNAYGWSVVISIPQTELAAAARRASAKALGAAGVLLLIGLVTALYAARGISATIHALSRAATELGVNRVPARLDSGVREVDEVSAELHAAGVKAQQANTVLEQRVVEAVRQAEEAQSKLLHSQNLETIGRLTAGVAHDFNNLLQTITTSHHILGRRLEREGELNTLASAVRATSKARDLVRQLLTFGRVPRLEPALVNVADVVLKGHALTSKAVGERIVLSAALEQGLPPLYVDPIQFEMAVLNLVFNARDALPAGGHITISARLATAAEAAGLGESAFVRLEVADDGAGMSEETQARAFEPYFTTKPVGSGTGIGLAQVKSFAQQSGGAISLHSALGEGTRVGLLLPAAEPQAAAAQVPAAAPARQQALKVLMVEDDALVSSVVVAALEGEGFTLRLCHTADEAAALLRTGEAFDVLFTDVVMPGSLSGIELVEWSRRHRPALPVVVTTGYAENLSRVSATVLRKPYEIEALVGTLHEAFRSAGTGAGTGTGTSAAPAPP